MEVLIYFPLKDFFFGSFANFNAYPLPTHLFTNGYRSSAHRFASTKVFFLNFHIYLFVSIYVVSHINIVPVIINRIIYTWICIATSLQLGEFVPAR